MSYALEMSAGDMRQVARLLTAVERTPEQELHLGRVREQCKALDVRLQSQGAGLDVPVIRALEELIEGAPSRNMCPAYAHAFHEVVASCFSDVTDLGSWRRMSWFQTVSNDLARHGVPAPLLPETFLFSGPPLPLPHPGDVHPQIGTLSIHRAAEAATAYTAVLDRVHPDCQDTVRRFTEAFRFEVDEWRANSTADTLFFWFD
ncbi:hypothetical protein IAG44_26130 [Streptomyces roseirectus]|uniref:DUF7691 domain-containing protein n=1 Tax=Streptomyces roseirectus TaxID=2768066 RepID=A0A7H0IIE5_9ACTN|nr:hypothetical protein [Streptomyces roseirectus]QNP72561.1 hypothetical protein IAG44_26130 [Streptomyces roseirectus]